jgi:hypothetical protein
MHHITLNRPWPDDRHFDHHIVKTFRLHPRQSCHLRAAFDLKNAYGVCLLHALERLLVILGNVSKIEWPSPFAA